MRPDSFTPQRCRINLLKEGRIQDACSTLLGKTEAPSASVVPDAPADAKIRERINARSPPVHTPLTSVEWKKVLSRLSWILQRSWTFKAIFLDLFCFLNQWIRVCVTSTVGPSVSRQKTSPPDPVVSLSVFLRFWLFCQTQILFMVALRHWAARPPASAEKTPYANSLPGAGQVSVPRKAVNNFSPDLIYSNIKQAKKVSVLLPSWPIYIHRKVQTRLIHNVIPVIVVCAMDISSLMNVWRHTGSF